MSIQKNRYYFQKDAENCYDLAYHYQYMAENNLKEMEVYLAKRETQSPYFFCKHFQQTGQRGECGQHCEAYKPRNGISGVCQHFGYTYQQTNTKLNLKVNNGKN